MKPEKETNKQFRERLNRIGTQCEIWNKGYLYGKSKAIKQVDKWFNGRGQMEKWEWIKLKSKLGELTRKQSSGDKK